MFLFLFQEIMRPLNMLPKPFKEFLDEWDSEFSKCDLGLLLKIAEAANYLNIADLTSLTHAKLIDIIKDCNNEKEKILATFKPYMHLKQTGVA